MFIPQLTLHGSISTLSSPLKAVRSPELCWPEQILTKPIIVGEKAGKSTVLLADVAELKRVFSAGEQLFPKWLPAYKHSAARETGPNSILAVDDATWKPMRDAFAPLFASDKYDLLAANAVDAICRVVESYKDKFDFQQLISAAVVNVIWRTLLGEGIGSETQSFLDEIGATLVTVQRDGSLSDNMDHIRTLAAHMAQRPSGKYAMASVDFGKTTLPQRLAHDVITDNRLALLYAGQETTVMSLCWVCWLLGQDSGLQQTLRNEIKAAVTTEHITLESLKQMPLLQSVIKETLRLLSPSVSTVRTTSQATMLSGILVDAGSIIIVPVYALHRHSNYWHNSHSFIADRFITSEIIPFSYLPFSAGRHTCIASRSVMVEMQVILATLLLNYSWQTQNAETMGLTTKLVLSPSCPMDIVFR